MTATYIYAWGQETLSMPGVGGQILCRRVASEWRRGEFLSEPFRHQSAFFCFVSGEFVQYLSLTLFVFPQENTSRVSQFASRTEEPIHHHSELPHRCRRWDLTCISSLLSGVKLNAAQSQSGAERSFEFHFLCPFIEEKVVQFWPNWPQCRVPCRVTFHLTRLTRQGWEVCKLQNSSPGS